MSDSTKKRHIAKTISWRVIGTIDTMILSFLISGNPFIGLKIGVAELITKMLLYYFHERIWFKINLSKEGVRLESWKRHMIKTLTWRALGTLDTILLAWLISGDALVGVKIGAAEVVSKMIFYYLHERVWYKIDFGLNSRKSKDQYNLNRNSK